MVLLGQRPNDADNWSAFVRLDWSGLFLAQHVTLSAASEGAVPDKGPRECVRAPAAKEVKHEPTAHGLDAKASGRRERLTCPSGGRGRLRGPKVQGQAGRTGGPTTPRS